MADPFAIPFRISKNVPPGTALLLTFDGRREIVTDNFDRSWIRWYAAVARQDARAHLGKLVREAEARLGLVSS